MAGVFAESCCSVLFWRWWSSSNKFWETLKWNSWWQYLVANSFLHFWCINSHENIHFAREFDKQNLGHFDSKIFKTFSQFDFCEIQHECLFWIISIRRKLTIFLYYFLFSSVLLYSLFTISTFTEQFLNSSHHEYVRRLIGPTWRKFFSTYKCAFQASKEWYQSSYYLQQILITNSF